MYEQYKKFLSLQKLTGKRNYSIYLIIAASILTIIFYFPDYSIARTNNFTQINQQIENPFVPYVGEDEHWMQRQYRIIIPSIAHLLGLDGYALWIIQMLMIIPFYGITYNVLKQISGDESVSTFLTIALAFGYVGKSFFVVHPYYDAIAYIILIMSINTTRSYLVFLFVVTAGFIDERAILATVIVFVWHSVPLAGNQHSLIAQLFKFNNTKWAVVLGWMTYLTGRIWLSNQFGFSTQFGQDSGVEWSIFNDNLNFIPFAALLALEGFWIIVLVLAANLYTEDKSSILIMAILLLIILAPMLFVIDMSRSAAYAFLIPFLLIKINQHVELRLLRQLSLYCLMASFLIPTYIIFGGVIQSIHWMKPLPAILLRHFLSM